jgi:hypothetical protein
MIRILFATAIGLFVLSLPIHATGVGATMRRWAGFCFLAGLLPSLFFGLILPESDEAFASHPIGWTIALFVAMVIAYAAYRIRVWLREDPAKKQARLMEKTPIEQARRQQDLLAFLNQNQPPQGPTP